MRSRVVFVFLYFIAIQVYALPAFNDLFTYQWSPENKVVTFHYKAGDVHALAKAKLHFFTMDDCQAGYLGEYPIQSTAKGFGLHVSHDFSLLANTTYQAASSVLGNEKISLIHAVLIQLVGSGNELPRFLTACADQGINCCVAIECSDDSGTCMPKYQFPRQTFVLFKRIDVV